MSKQAQIALQHLLSALSPTTHTLVRSPIRVTLYASKRTRRTVNALQRHTAISVEKLDDQDFQLTIDKANYFAFKMDDIEDQFSHVDFVSLAADRAAYKMADAIDVDILRI